MNKNADDSFGTNSSNDFLIGFPDAGLKLAQNPILLKLKKVDKHNDPWVGDWDFQPPEHARRAIFWLMKSPASITFTCGDQTVELVEGDWVLFNDAIEHSVQATKQWKGSAAQVFIRMEPL